MLKEIEDIKRLSDEMIALTREPLLQDMIDDEEIPDCDLCDDTGSLEDNDGFTSPCECNPDDEDMSGSCGTNDR